MALHLVPPSTPTESASSSEATRPSVAHIPESARIAIGEGGYIHGIDRMLSQVARAFVGEAMPHVREDHAMQARVGQAIGQEIAKPLWVLAGVAVAGTALYLLGRSSGEAPPSRVRKKRSFSRRS